MEDVAVVGIDLAKSVLQVHGIDAAGKGTAPLAVDSAPVLNDDRFADEKPTFPAVRPIIA